MKVNELIKSRRNDLGMTMLDVAKKVGVSEATISRWETGNISNFKRDKIAKLAKVLMLQVSDLIDSNSELDNSLISMNIKRDRRDLHVLIDNLDDRKIQKVKNILLAIIED